MATSYLGTPHKRAVKGARSFEEVMENAITVAKNDEQTIPIRDLDKKSIAYSSLLYCSRGVQ